MTLPKQTKNKRQTCLFRTQFMQGVGEPSPPTLLAAAEGWDVIIVFKLLDETGGAISPRGIWTVDG